MWHSVATVNGEMNLTNLNERKHHKAATEQEHCQGLQGVRAHYRKLHR